MRHISKRAIRSFEKWGKMGGKVRARVLSSHERSAIAARAARARWKEHPSSHPSLPSVRLGNPQLEDPVYLEEVLSDGTWKDWQKLYQAIADRPFGTTAAALEKVCLCVKIYGVTTLWMGILQLTRGGAT